VRKIEIMFRHDPKRTDGRQRAAVFTVKLVNSVAVNDQLSPVAARLVEIAHQGFPRIVFIPVARVVNARPLVVGISGVVLPRIVPSSVGHRPSLRRSRDLGCP
jgi:hypothetical protein